MMVAARGANGGSRFMAAKWIGLLVLAGAAAVVEGEIGSRPVHISGSSSWTGEEFLRFGFKPGGMLQVQVTLGETEPLLNSPHAARDRGLFFMACAASSEPDLMSSMGNAFFCNEGSRFAPTGCTVTPIQWNKTLIAQEIQERSVYYLSIWTCNYRDVDIASVSWVAINPGGEHLGTLYEPLRFAYTCLLCVWLLAFILFFINLVRNLSTLTRLHRILICVPVVWMAYCTINFSRWAQLSAHGFIPPWLEDTWGVAPIFVQSTVYGVSMLAALGFDVCRRHVTLADQRGLFTTVVLYLALITVREYVRSVAFLVGLAASMLFMTTLVCAISGLLRMFAMQARALGAEGLELRGSSIIAKANIYRAFQFLVFTNVCCKIVLDMSRPLLDKEYPWVRILAQEVVELAYCLVIGWLFRLRQPDIFRAGNEAIEARMTAIRRLLALRASRSALGIVHPVEQTEPVEWCSEIEGSLPPGIVVVENPPTVSPDGKLIRSVSLAFSPPQSPTSATALMGGNAVDSAGGPPSGTGSLRVLGVGHASALPGAAHSPVVSPIDPNSRHPFAWRPVTTTALAQAANLEVEVVGAGRSESHLSHDPVVNLVASGTILTTFGGGPMAVRTMQSSPGGGSVRPEGRHRVETVGWVTEHGECDTPTVPRAGFERAEDRVASGVEWLGGEEDGSEESGEEEEEHAVEDVGEVTGDHPSAGGSDSGAHHRRASLDPREERGRGEAQYNMGSAIGTMVQIEGLGKHARRASLEGRGSGADSALGLRPRSSSIGFSSEHSQQFVSTLLSNAEVQYGRASKVSPSDQSKERSMREEASLGLSTEAHVASGSNTRERRTSNKRTA